MVSRFDWVKSLCSKKHEMWMIICFHARSQKDSSIVGLLCLSGQLFDCTSHFLQGSFDQLWGFLDCVRTAMYFVIDSFTILDGQGIHFTGQYNLVWRRQCPRQPMLSMTLCRFQLREPLATRLVSGAIHSPGWRKPIGTNSRMSDHSATALVFRSIQNTK